MPKLIYKDWKPGPVARSVVANAETICANYEAQGYNLTPAPALLPVRLQGFDTQQRG